MQSFISKVIGDLINRNIVNHKIILPSKRAGVFFKEQLKNQLNSFAFLPEILSIEELIQDISETELVLNTEILFQFYKIYLANTPKDKIIDFDQFINWATIILQDFNEIDRQLIDVNYLFNYLSDIHRIENWFLNNNKPTKLTENYINFYNSFAIYYKEFYNHLLKQKKGYQGLQYREASKNINSYLKKHKKAKLIFVGFNALNKAEELIIKKTLDQNIGEIYFDTDEFLIKNIKSYANFVFKYKSTWNHFNTTDFHFISNDFIQKKQIDIIGIPKNVSIIKETGVLLKKIKSKTNNFQNTTLVLANEDLLTTALNSLPNEVTNVNITMGYPLKNIELSNLFTHLFKLQKNKQKIGDNKSFYHKDIITILNHTSLSKYYINNRINISDYVRKIHQNNHVFIEIKELIKYTQDNKELKYIIQLLFSSIENTNQLIDKCLKLIESLELLNNNSLEFEYLNRFNKLFQQLKNLNHKYGYITTINSLQLVYKQLLNTESLAFKGEPLSGLQIMGMLETRVLDFENVIITSVNEGFIPSGKTNNSFIPFDVKREFDIPTYQEKDAIFSYHFFRLLQRAKNIYLLYNTETDDFGSGEQSRFITQLEILNNKLPNCTIHKSIVSPKLNNSITELILVEKTPLIHKKLKDLAIKGISPTTLTNYIYNPIEFYKNKILGIKSVQELEETIAANTLGTVIHKTLEELYKPYINIFLSVDDIASMQQKSEQIIKKYFKLIYKNGDITSGKNLLTFEVSKHYINTFLKQELKLLKTGKQIKILALEIDLETTIKTKNINYPIKIRGQADRIDELDGVVRIIDYKTGKVEQKNLTIKNWELITTDYKKYSKSFQVLMYAYMYIKTNNINMDRKDIESGIISFKNLKSGYLKVNKKPITEDEINNFEIELFYLIEEIYSEKPFIENENLPF